MRETNYIIGYPLTSSLSPAVHQWIYHACRIQADMQLFSNASLQKIVKILKQKKSGLIAVTMPYKNQILSYCDEVSESARASQAVNTIIIEKGKWRGANTDVDGIAQTLNQISLKNKKILILGGGGAARAFAYFAKSLTCEMFFCNRRDAVSHLLAAEFNGQSIAFSRLGNEYFSGIVNATPLGMHGFSDARVFPKNLFHAKQFVFDMIYNPLETALLTQAKMAGAQTFSGLKMFFYQAIAQVGLWKKMDVLNQIDVEKGMKILKGLLT